MRTGIDMPKLEIGRPYFLKIPECAHIVISKIASSIVRVEQDTQGHDQHYDVNRISQNSVQKYPRLGYSLVGCVGQRLSI